MADPRMQPTGGEVPFDMKRMIVGGFKPIVRPIRTGEEEMTMTTDTTTSSGTS